MRSVYRTLYGSAHIRQRVCQLYLVRVSRTGTRARWLGRAPCQSRRFGTPVTQRTGLGGLAAPSGRSRRSDRLTHRE